MNINVDRLRKQLRDFDFRKLFINELGWDKTNTDTTVTVDGQDYFLQAVAQKRGMVVFHCPTPDGETFPDYATRRKIDNKTRKTFHEHLIIFTDPTNTQQKWQWVRRETGKPSAGREIGFGAGQSGEALIQRLQALAFSLEEEEGLTILDVTSRVRAGFDLERVTKRFYDRFKTEHTAFLKFLKGIPDEDSQRWYVSVTLNRLMFVYFIQWKGFLDGDQHYLRNRLERTRQQLGEDHFYRDFLCPLFFEGFAKKERTPQSRALLGNVPYLNGGIFQRHQLEERFGQAIQIPDAAFTRLFDFFDGYNWHLDERPLRDDREINPDVLGFIFEKYINQKQMGAYYTKEDITGYISKYTILPAVFERVHKDCRIAFEGESAVWNYLAAEPERFIYPAMLKGLDLPLPENIAAGLDDVAQRGDWNRPADEAYALPTEIWRETVARRQQAEEVRLRLTKGEVRNINDLITYNLDIQQFAQDVIESSEGPELVRAFWKTLVDIKVLDPTCGSGAFLFAALNILEPLYEACLDRMQSFVDELDASIAQGEKHHPEKYSDFRRILSQVARHHNRSYFIFKNIIVNNLYGVDIMEEAVEICKLRLFLKLIAQVGSAQHIEPLPDIDFNVRAGNTLVGFVSRNEVHTALTSEGKQRTFAIKGEALAIDRVEEQANLADKAFQRFRQMQTDEEMDPSLFAAAKEELLARLKALNDELNHALALRYLNAPIQAEDYESWMSTYQPFHWFVDFYGIMKSGGFDVIIGNPPYIEYSQVKKSYTLLGYSTLDTGNLYSYVIERSYSLLANSGSLSMIVQLPIVCTDRMIPLQKLCLDKSQSVWFSTFDDRPARLFDGLEHIRATIFTSLQRPIKQQKRVYSTPYNRWYSEQRPVLFELLAFENITGIDYKGSIPKVGSNFSSSISRKLRHFSQLGFELNKNGFPIYFHNAPQYWIRAMNFAPYFWNERVGEQISTQVKRLNLSTNENALAVVAILNSSLFYWWFILLSDCRHLNKREIDTFPVSLRSMSSDIKKALGRLALQLMDDLRHNSKRKEAFYKTTGQVKYDEFYPRFSKPIIDQIDRILAQHYDFSFEELDFIINYDIKYRLGSTTEENEEE